MQNDFALGGGSLGRGAGSKNQRKIAKRKKKANSDIRGFDMENSSNEYRVKKKILVDTYYDKTTRPVRSDETTMHLFVGMSLYHILDTVSLRVPLSLVCTQFPVKIIFNDITLAGFKLFRDTQIFCHVYA